MSPSRTRIKICGLRDQAAALAAVDAGADAIGLVFVEKSARYVTDHEAAAVIEGGGAFVATVGLFVNKPTTFVREKVDGLGLAAAQLHGSETVEDVAALMPTPVVKAVALDPQDPVRALLPWQHGPANLAAILIDTPAPNPDVPGGTGVTFDWRMLTDLRDAGALEDLPPIVLSGGLTPDNVADAIAAVRPYAVDVSTGVESSRGVKDPALIRAFCEAVRQADAR